MDFAQRVHRLLYHQLELLLRIRKVDYRIETYADALLNRKRYRVVIFLCFIRQIGQFNENSVKYVC